MVFEKLHFYQHFLDYPKFSSETRTFFSICSENMQICRISKRKVCWYEKSYKDNYSCKGKYNYKVSATVYELCENMAQKWLN